MLALRQAVLATWALATAVTASATDTASVELNLPYVAGGGRAAS